jgi:hypothetical protein
MIQNYEPGQFTMADANNLHGKTVTVTTYDGRDSKGMGLEAATYEETTAMYVDGDPYLFLGEENLDGWFDTDTADAVSLADVKTVEVHP